VYQLYHLWRSSETTFIRGSNQDNKFDSGTFGLIMPLPHHGGHNYQQLDSLDEENGDGDKTDDGDFVDGDRFIDANFTLTSPPKGDDNDEKDRSGINVSFADGSHSNAALEAVRWQAYLDSRASGYGAVVADASVSFAEYDREEEEVQLE
jgi:hypothetical protein